MFGKGVGGRAGAGGREGTDGGIALSKGSVCVCQYRMLLEIRIEIDGNVTTTKSESQ